MKEIGISFGIGAVVGGAFSKSFGIASKGISGLNKEIINLQRSQQLLAKYDKDKKALFEKARTIKQTKAAIEELRKSMKGEHGQTKENAKALSNLEKKLQNLNKSYSKELHGVRETAKLLKSKNIEIKNTAESYKVLEKQVQQATKATNRYNKAASLDKSAGRISKIGGKAITAGVAGLGLLYKPIQQAIKAEGAFADVKKQFDFDNKEEEDKFKKELHKIITEKKIAISLEELYGAAASAGQSGLNKKEAIQYIELASKIGMAFDMNREEAAKAMFEMRNALNLPYDGLVELTDKMNYLGNTTGASAANITDFVNRVGNIGKMAGFSADKVAAIGASLIEQGMDPDVAATGAKKVFSAMTKGSAVTKNQAKVYSALGINPVQLAKLAQNDAEKALDTLFMAISRKPKHEQGAIMFQLFGEEGKRGAVAIASNLERIHENLSKIKGTESKGSVDSEADIKRATTENQIEILKGKASIAFSQLGNLLLPEVNEILNSFSNLFSKITEFQELHPEGFKQFMKWIGYGSIAMLGFGAVLKPVSWGIKTYSKYMEVAGFMTEHKFGTKLFSVGKKLITGVGKGVKAIKGFGATLLGNPLTWYIAGILAIVAAGYLLYKNWDTVKQGAIDLKNKVVELVDKYWFMLGPLGALVKGGIEVYRNWDTIKEKARELKDNIANMVTNIILKWDSFKASTQEILGDVFSWIEGKWNSIKNTGAGVLEFYLGIFSKLQEKFDWLVDKGKSLLGIGEEPKYSPPGRSLQRYAAGGIVSNPTIAWVGEGGYSESIIPHDRSKRSLNLWEKTGQMIGAYDRSQSNSFQLVYSPTIQARDLQGVQQELKNSKEEAFREFKSMMREYEREQRRRGYGR